MLSTLAALLLANAVTLDATTKSLSLTTSTSVSTDYVVSYADATSSTFTPGTSQGNIASAGTTTILAAPAASTQRAVTMIAVTNRGTSVQAVQVLLLVSGTPYAVTPVLSLAAGEALRVNNEGSANILTAGGVKREVGWVDAGLAGVELTLYKVGTASEAVAINYVHAKDSGFPGAWVPGTPGVNGANLDCSTTGGATTAGAPYLPNPASGGYYLTYGSVATTVIHSTWVLDPVWYNTGLVVTTTTAQAITTPTFPARDNQGSTNGEGYQAGIYVTTATTNAGAVTTITLNYTNSDGTAGRTATMASFPATAVLGTFVPFQLAAGDRGIRSIQGITLGTTLTAGAISLVVYNTKGRWPVGIANVGTIYYPPQSPGVRLFNGTCLWLGYLSSATTATTSNASFWLMTR